MESSWEGWEASVSLLASDLFTQLSNYPLNVIVLFVLMGSFAFAAGMSGRLYDSANKIAGKIPAGLAVATIMACSGFAAICGSTAATAATIGRVSLPEMRRFGYSRRMATGCIASAGSIGILIPPSTIFIVYGILTEQSIGSLFAAGILPGFALTVLFILTIFAVFHLSKETAPSGQQYTLIEKVKALWRIADIFLLFALSIGGMFLGWYSPNQAAGVGAATGDAEDGGVGAGAGGGAGGGAGASSGGRASGAGAPAVIEPSAACWSALHTSNRHDPLVWTTGVAVLPMAGGIPSA